MSPETTQVLKGFGQLSLGSEAMLLHTNVQLGHSFIQSFVTLSEGVERVSRLDATFTDTVVR